MISKNVVEYDGSKPITHAGVVAGWSVGECIEVWFEDGTEYVNTYAFNDAISKGDYFNSH